jgi:putative flippase GtrA
MAKAAFHHPLTIAGRWSGTIQFIRFAVAGAISAAVEIGCLYALVKYAQLHYLLANTIAFLLANVVNYVFSRYWVYGQSKYVMKLEIAGFIATSGIGLLINQAILFLFYSKLGFKLILSKIVAIAITVVWNFFSKKHLVFKR